MNATHVDARPVETTVDFALLIALRKSFFQKSQLAFIGDRSGASKRAMAIFEYDNGSHTLEIEEN